MTLTCDCHNARHVPYSGDQCLVCWLTLHGGTIGTSKPRMTIEQLRAARKQ